MKREYDYIIAGGGLCGLILAKELVKKNKSVLILEKGHHLKKTGSIFDGFWFYDKHALSASRQGVNIYRIFGVGGTSIGSCANAVEFTDKEYAKIGIDFRGEVPAAKKECFVRDSGLPIGKASLRIMNEANKLGYTMRPMPKFSIEDKCHECGKCVFGCKYEEKWTAVECLKDIRDKVSLKTGFSVERVLSSAGKAEGIEGRQAFKRKKFFGNKIIISAGGIGTPVILQNSGMDAGSHLFVDLFNITYGTSKEYHQCWEVLMSVVCDKFHRNEGFVLSPCLDNYISLPTNVVFRDKLKVFQLNSLMGIMTKIEDDNCGRVYKNGKVDKAPTENDLKKLKKGSDISKEILIKCGVKPKSIFVTRPSGAHPGGTAGVGRVVDKNLETKIKGLYVCDCSVLPSSPGLPPMLGLIALTKWFAKRQT